MRKWILGGMGIFTLGLLIFMAGYLAIYLNGQKLLMANLEKLDMAESTVVYDKDGNEFTKLYMQNRELVTLDEVPDLLEEAVIATEDRRFDEHAGVDLWAIGRAAVKDIMHRDLVEGGSTITQQLAKNMFLSADKTFFRKATEVSIALALENNFTKEEILNMYLNRIYFGNGAYGVKAGAERHFGVADLNDLRLIEIAVLASLPKAPETYSPTNNPDKALERAAVVLQLMVDQGYITEAERRNAINDTLRKPSKGLDRTASAMKDYVLEEAAKLTQLSQEELRIGGYSIETTIDMKAQKALDGAFANPKLFPEDGPEQIVQGAMVIVDPKTGGIAAMSGGREYVEKGLNRSLAKRQPGSSFKPLAVYAPALETGNYHPYSMLRDEKLTYGNYSPSNLSGRYAGQMTMYEALQRSINAPAVWLLNEIGVEQGLNFAKKAGIEMDASDRNLSIALGGLTNGASPLEMAGAFGAFANNGMLADPFVIREIKNSSGQTIYKHEPKLKKIMSEQTAYYMTYMLQAVTKQGGTGTKANFGRPVAGKTGTTQLGLKGVRDSAGNRDIWFVGYTPEYAAAVWMGFDKTNESHYLKTGSGTAAAMFAEVMGKALEGKKVQQFKRPEGVSEPKRAAKPVADLTAFYDAERNEALLSWSPSTEEGTAQYRVYRKESGETSFSMILETAATDIIDITLLPGKTYQYYVTVTTSRTQTESKPSNTVEIVVPEEDEGMGIGEDFPELPEQFPDDRSQDEEGNDRGDRPGRDGNDKGGAEETSPPQDQQVEGDEEPSPPPADGNDAEPAPEEENPPSFLTPPQGL